MNRFLGRVVLGVTGAAFLVSLGMSSVFAANVSKPTYEAVAGNFARQTNASAYAAKLTKAGLGAFKVEIEKVGTKIWYQAEIPYSTMAAAAVEVGKLHAAKYRGGVEIDKDGSN